MSKIVINTLNINIGSGVSHSSRDLSGLFGALLSSDHEVHCSPACDGTVSVDVSARSDHEVHCSPACDGTVNVDVSARRADLGTEKVMLARQTTNSSTGLELTDTRESGHQISATAVAAHSLAVVRADSALGEAARAAGVIRTNGFVNTYASSGNVGRTIHATMAKAENYADGDAVAVEVFVINGDDLQPLVA